MQRAILMALLFAAAALPAATAHTPPAPVSRCEPFSTTHEYAGSSAGSAGLVPVDGSLDKCGTYDVGAFGTCLISFGPCPGYCEVNVGKCSGTCDVNVGKCSGGCTVNVGDCAGYCSINVGSCGSLGGCTLNIGTCDAASWLLPYDGDFEFAIGGAFLFVNSGDGVTSGVTACYGWPSVGHHTTTIFAQDVLGAGPQFTVTSDYSRAGLEESPDCGDGYVEACDPTTPVPSTQPFPVNVVIDTVNQVLYSVFGPGGVGCNPLDGQQRFASNPAGPSGGAVAFGAGADGALVVFVEPDTNAAIVSQAGHIWTA